MALCLTTGLLIITQSDISNNPRLMDDWSSEMIHFPRYPTAISSVNRLKQQQQQQINKQYLSAVEKSIHVSTQSIDCLIGGPDPKKEKKTRKNMDGRVWLDGNGWKRCSGCSSLAKKYISASNRLIESTNSASSPSARRRGCCCCYCCCGGSILVQHVASWYTGHAIYLSLRSMVARSRLMEKWWWSFFSSFLSFFLSFLPLHKDLYRWPFFFFSFIFPLLLLAGSLSIAWQGKRDTREFGTRAKKPYHDR